MHFRLPDTRPIEMYFFHLAFRLSRRLPLVGTLTDEKVPSGNFLLVLLCLEALLARECEAAYSADLGTSSKESY